MPDATALARKILEIFPTEERVAAILWGTTIERSIRYVLYLKQVSNPRWSDHESDKENMKRHQVHPFVYKIAAAKNQTEFAIGIDLTKEVVNRLIVQGWEINIE